MGRCPTAIELAGRNCTGCEACTASCPRQALQMEMDGEGFFYPKVDEKLCNHCGLCAKRCPVVSPNVVERQMLPETGYAGGHREKSVRLSSASGGAFSAVVAASQADAVYGAAWTGPDCVEHLRVTPQELTPLQTSKYIQSRMGDAYQRVKVDLEAERRVVFSGTPCQVAGLLSYLGRPSDHLITVEIMCHGVGSPGIFQKYLEQLSMSMGSKVTSYAFRTKNSVLGDWENFHSVIQFENGLLQSSYWEPFTQLFLAGYVLRPSCEGCGFSGKSAHVADVILGDYWGCSVHNPALYDKRGVSVLIPLTPTGERLLVEAKAYMNLAEVPLLHITDRNAVLLKRKGFPLERNGFFQAVAEQGLDAAIQRYCPRPSWKSRLKPYLRPFFKKLRG